MDPNIHFEALNDSHFPLIHRWFNQPHVKAFYSLRAWTLKEVQQKLNLQSQKQIHAFIIYLDQKPIGYIQCYPVKDHPWENQQLANDIVEEAAGFDVFIGEEEYLQQGLGSKIIDCFLKQYIWPTYRYCIVDPDIRNEASLRLFQKYGFQKHKEILALDAVQRPVTLLLLIKKKSA